MVWKEFYGSCLFSTTFKSFTQKQKQFLQMLWRSNGHKFSLPHAIKNRTSILLSPILIHWHWSRWRKIVPKNASDGSSFFNPMPRQPLALLRQAAVAELTFKLGWKGRKRRWFLVCNFSNQSCCEGKSSSDHVIREGLGARGCWNHQEFSPSQVPQPTLVSLD